jgi:hypothetical protein
MVEFSKPYKKLTDIIIHYVNPVSLGGKVYILLKIPEGVVVVTLEIVYLSKYLDNPWIVTAYIPARQGKAPGFFVTAQPDKTPADYYVRFKVVWIGSNFFPAYLYGTLKITVPVLP